MYIILGAYMYVGKSFAEFIKYLIFNLIFNLWSHWINYFLCQKYELLYRWKLFGLFGCLLI